MNVERPPARSSAAPMRVKIASSGPSFALRAGTYMPQWASRATIAVCRMYVDLPPMLGPVTMSRRRSALSITSLGTKLSTCCATTG